MPDHVPDSAMRTGIDKAIQGLRYNFTDTTAQVIIIPIETVLDHDIGIITTITGVTHNAPIPHIGVLAIDLAMTLHIDHTTDHPCTGTHHTTAEIEACHIHAHPTNPHDVLHIGLTCTPVDHEVNHITRRAPE